LISARMFATGLSGSVRRHCCLRPCDLGADLYCVKVPSHRANHRITGLILGRIGRSSPQFPRVDLCFPVLCGDIVGSTMGSTVDRDLQSGRGRFETLSPSSEGLGAAVLLPPHALHGGTSFRGANS
jgi:hypothetical protein